MALSKGKQIGIALTWVAIAAIAAVTIRWYFRPKLEEAAQVAKQEEKKQVLVNTSAEARYKYQVSLAVDGFSGYCILRSEEFSNECSSRGVKLTVIDEPDYEKRLRDLQSGTIQMASFTIDALIKNSAKLGEMPATVVCLLDETRGADAAVAYGKAVPNIDVLNDRSTKFVATKDSPSETLGRVMQTYFNLDQITSDNWVWKNSSKEVYEHYRASKPGEKVVYFCWEPEVSKMLANPEYRKVIDSSKFHGYIVDVLIVSRDFLLKNEEVVGKVVESYLASNFKYRSTMIDLVQRDASELHDPLKPEQAKVLVDGIWWKNTQENYAHFGFTSGHGLQHVEDMVINITKVLQKTGAISTDPTGGAPNMLYYDKVLRRLFDNNFHPGFGAEKVREESALAALSDDDWKTLVPVGTLQVPRLVFARGTAKLTPASEEVLLDLSQKLKTWPQYYLVVRGHCATGGDVALNTALAKQRADATVAWLTQNGIDQKRVRADISEPNGSMTVAFILGQLPY